MKLFRTSLDGPSPWLRFKPALLYWDAGAIFTLGVTAFLVAFDPLGTAGVNAVGSYGSLGVILLGYFAFGRRSLLPKNNGIPLQVLLIGATAIGSVFHTDVLFMQILIYPAAWITSKTVQWGIIANVAAFLLLTAGYTLGIVTGINSSPGSPVIHYVVQVLSVGFSFAIAGWMTWLFSYAAERADLLSKLSSAQAELEVFHREAGATDERQRIARDMHDTIAQSLVSQVMIAQTLARELDRVPEVTPVTRNRVDLLEDIAGDALREARLLILDNAPYPAPETGLGDAVETLLVRFERETGIAVSWESELSVGEMLPREVEVVVLRSIQEGLANIRKHATASAVQLTIASGNGVHVELRDDGVGLGTNHGGGFGLAGMRERVRSVRGELHLSSGDSSTGRPGTILRIDLPPQLDRHES